MEGTGSRDGAGIRLLASLFIYTTSCDRPLITERQIRSLEGAQDLDLCKILDMGFRERKLSASE